MSLFLEVAAFLKHIYYKHVLFKMILFCSFTGSRVFSACSAIMCKVHSNGYNAFMWLKCIELNTKTTKSHRLVSSKCLPGYGGSVFKLYLSCVVPYIIIYRTSLINTFESQLKIILLKCNKYNNIHYLDTIRSDHSKHASV